MQKAKEKNRLILSIFTILLVIALGVTGVTTVFASGDSPSNSNAEMTEEEMMEDMKAIEEGDGAGILTDEWADYLKEDGNKTTFKIVEVDKSLKALNIPELRASTGTLYYMGPIHQSGIAGSRVGKFKVNGKLAFCLYHPKATPFNNYNKGGQSRSVAISSISSANVLKTLYYGYGGPEQWSGFKNYSANHSIVITSLAGSVANIKKSGDTGKNWGNYRSNVAGYAKFVDFVAKQPALNFSTSLSTKSLSGSFDKNGNVKTTSMTVSGGTNANYSFTVPSGMNAVVGSKTYKSGSKVAMKKGNSVYFVMTSNSVAGKTISIKGTTSKYVGYEWIPLPRHNNWQNMGQLGAVPTAINLSVTFPKTTSLSIKKVGPNGEALKGASFNLKGNAYNQNATTDANGVAKFSDIPTIKGMNLALTETSAPSGYYIQMLDSDKNIIASKHSFTVNSDGKISVNLPSGEKDTVSEISGTNNFQITNAKKVNLTLVKDDAKSKFVEGATFNLSLIGTLPKSPGTKIDTSYAVTENSAGSDGVYLNGYNYDKTVKTDKDGKISFNDLVPGFYKLKEIAPANGYYFEDNVPTEYLIYVSEEHNSNGTASAKISKVLNWDNSYAGLSGEELLNLTKDMTSLKRESLSSDRTAGLSSEKNVTLGNKKYSEFDILKTDSDSNNSIQGVGFVLVSEKTGQRITARTNSDGIAHFGGLKDDTYILTESFAATGYRKIETAWKIEAVDSEVTIIKFENMKALTDGVNGEEVSLNKDGQLSIENQKKAGLTIYKVGDNDGEEDDVFLSGAIFSLTNVDTKKSENKTTNKMGVATWDNLTDGKYILKELKSPEGYVVGKENLTRKVTVEDGKVSMTDSDQVSVKPEEFWCMENEGKYVYLTTPSDGAEKINGYVILNEPEREINAEEFYFHKMDATGEAEGGLIGADFEILNLDPYGCMAYIEEVRDGKFFVGFSENGEYELKEIAAPENYYTDSETSEIYKLNPHFFKLIDGKISAYATKEDMDSDTNRIAPDNTRDGYVFTYVDKKYHDVVIEKRDSVSNSVLSGAIFELSGRSAKGEDISQTRMVSMLGRATFNSIPEGSYVITEVKSPDGYGTPNYKWTVEVDANKGASVRKVPLS